MKFRFIFHIFNLMLNQELCIRLTDSSDEEKEWGKNDSSVFLHQRMGNPPKQDIVKSDCVCCCSCVSEWVYVFELFERTRSSVQKAVWQNSRCWRTTGSCSKTESQGHCGERAETDIQTTRSQKWEKLNHINSPACWAHLILKKLLKEELPLLPKASSFSRF